MRAVFESLGVADVVTKSVGTSNPYNMIRATFEALKDQTSPKSVAQRRGKKVADLLGRGGVDEAEAEADRRSDHGVIVMAKIKITQTGSPIRRDKTQRATLVGLGLNKMHRTVEVEDTPEVRGAGPQGRAPGRGRGLNLNRLRPAGSGLMRDKSESECRLT